MFIKLLKSISVVAIALPLLSLAGFEAVYWYNLNKIKPIKIMHEKQFDGLVHDTLWVSIGEVDDIEVVPSSATRFVLSFMKLALSGDYSKAIKALPTGSRLTSLIARNIVYKKNFRRNWHLNNIVVSIWASNEYSATEALDHILNNAAFGYGYNKFDDAAEFYFDKLDSELSISEVVALIAITHSPSALSPYCKRDRLVIRGNNLAEKLAEFKPEKYGGLSFEMPNFISHTEIKCN